MPEAAQIGAKLVVPRIAAERCGNCKFSRQMPETPYGDQPLCLRNPPLRTPIVLMHPAPNAPGQPPQMQITVQHEMTVSPAPDYWWCGEWKPRFVSAT